MAVRRLGPEQGTLQVNTYREGVAQRVGHDLVIEVEHWDAAVELGADDTIAAVRLDADPTSLRVREGHRGVKPLTDGDREQIRGTIESKLLHGEPISFESSAIEPRPGGLTVSGELTLAGTTRAATFELERGPEDRITATLPLTQSRWGIKPYSALMGALKVRDAVEIVIDVERAPA